jgi:hypothetical protein
MNTMIVVAGVVYPFLAGGFLLVTLWLGARWGFRRLRAGFSIGGARFYIEAGDRPGEDGKA